MLYFIALLPPASLQEEIQRIKLEFREKYQSAHSLNAPPHITLLSPFRTEQIEEIEVMLRNFVNTVKPIQITLNGFNHFGEGVIYMEVLQNSQLAKIQGQLEKLARVHRELFHYGYRQRIYQPHISLAFKDLTKENFEKAWREFKNQTFQADFEANQLVLFYHQDKKWHIKEQFDFGKN